MKNDEKCDEELKHLSVLGSAMLFSCPVLGHRLGNPERILFKGPKWPFGFVQTGLIRQGFFSLLYFSPLFFSAALVLDFGRFRLGAEFWGGSFLPAYWPCFCSQQNNFLTQGFEQKLTISFFSLLSVGTV